MVENEKFDIKAFIDSLPEKTKENLHEFLYAPIDTDEIDIDEIDITQKKYLKRVYKVYKILKEKNTKSYNIADDIYRAGFIASFYDNDKFFSFFVNNGITKEKVLNYYKIKPNEIKNIEDVSDGKLLFILDFFPHHLDKDEMKMFCIKKDYVCRDIEEIGSIIINSSYSLMISIKKYINELDYKKEAKKLSGIYNGLNNELISFIRICSMQYDNLKPKTIEGKKYSDNDILELAIIICFANLYSFSDESNYLKSLFPNFLLFDHYDQIKEYEIKGNITLIQKNFSKYIFSGVNKNIERCNIKPIDIVNNCFNKNLNYSENLLDILNINLVNYDNFSGKFKYNCLDQLVKQKLEKVEIKDVIFIANLSKELKNEFVKNGIDDDQFVNQLALFINAINTNESINNCFINNGLTLERIFSTLKIDIDINKIRSDENFDYEYIKDGLYHYLDIYYKLENLEGYIETIILNINESKYTNLYNLFNSILTTNIPKLQKDFENRHRNEKIDKLRKIEVPTISIINFDTISSFDLGLRKQSEEIINDFLDFTSKDDTDDFNEITNDIREFCKLEKKSKIEFIFFKEKKINIDNKKKLISKIEKYLKEKEVKLEKGLVELEYLKKAINIYLKNASLYLDRINEVKSKLIEEVKTKNYIENDIEITDDNLRMQIINDKIECINVSIVQMMQQYKKIVLQMSTHASLLNYINVSRNTTIKNLYIEFVLNDGIKLEKESIIYLKALKILLKDIENYTNNHIYIDKNNLRENRKYEIEDIQNKKIIKK